MITPSDPDYAETKLVKLGKLALMPLFEKLADWIAVSYTSGPSVSVFIPSRIHAIPRQANKIASGPHMANMI
jgi:hypothetical protein